MIESLKQVVRDLEETAARREQLAASESLERHHEQLRMLAKADRELAGKYKDQVKILEEELDS